MCCDVVSHCVVVSAGFCEYRYHTQPSTRFKTVITCWPRRQNCLNEFKGNVNENDTSEEEQKTYINTKTGVHVLILSEA